MMLGCVTESEMLLKVISAVAALARARKLGRLSVLPRLQDAAWLADDGS